ncbi:PucR family transcriptional regulator [Nitriliruptoraceae bacterium ZYF776]|nr:PucR family transcriptional regulator [Profundirhabdus halotolerans]
MIPSVSARARSILCSEGGGATSDCSLETTVVEPRRLAVGGEPLLGAEVVAALRAQLPVAAGSALTAVTDEVPEYARTLRGDIASDIERAIEAALGTFLRVLAPEPEDEGAAPIDAARRGAYELGRGEARAGRTADALLAAYRVGARVAWREMSSSAVEQGTPAPVVARFAELVFAYIDELSAASVAGHADEVAATGRRQQERRDLLGRTLLTGAPTSTLVELADQAGWPLPDTLTAVVLPAARVHDTLPYLDVATLHVPADAVAPDADGSGRRAGASTGDQDAATSVLLVADVVRTRAYLRRTLEGRGAVIGPPRPWTRVRESLQVAARARQLLGDDDGGAVLDATDHLATLVVGADPAALQDLRDEVLAPLGELSPGAADRLGETLRAWLLHLGRRREVAEALHVHPQTVRYRMNQVRDLYGDRLDDPDTVEALVIALAGARPGT